MLLNGFVTNLEDKDKGFMVIIEVLEAMNKDKVKADSSIIFYSSKKDKMKWKALSIDDPISFNFYPARATLLPENEEYAGGRASIFARGISYSKKLTNVAMDKLGINESLDEFFVMDKKDTTT